MLNSVDDQLNTINIAKQLRKLRIITEWQYQKVYWSVFFCDFNSMSMLQEMHLPKSPTLRIFQAKPSADD